MFNTNIIAANIIDDSKTTAISNKPEKIYTEIPHKIQKTNTVQNYLILSDKEIRDFAALLYLEAGGTSIECQKAVASTVLNRMYLYNTNLYDTIYASGQFTPAHKIKYTKPNPIQIEIIKSLCKTGPTIPKTVIYFRADYYFSWAKPYTNIDNVYFSMA